MDLEIRNVDVEQLTMKGNVNPELAKRAMVVGCGTISHRIEKDRRNFNCIAISIFRQGLKGLWWNGRRRSVDTRLLGICNGGVKPTRRIS
jgi:hypothetical protein